MCRCYRRPITESVQMKNEEKETQAAEERPKRKEVVIPIRPTHYYSLVKQQKVFFQLKLISVSPLDSRNNLFFSNVFSIKVDVTHSIFVIKNSLF